jgi:LysM repeat protein
MVQMLLSLLISLCADYMENCQSSALQLDVNSEELKVVGSLSSLNLQFHNQIIAAKDEYEIYAQVKEGDVYKILKIDVASATVISEIHSYGSQKRPFGMSFDSSTDTLFVGGIESFKGTMTIYKQDTLEGSFELSGVPYNSSFID